MTNPISNIPKEKLLDSIRIAAPCKLRNGFYTVTVSIASVLSFVLSMGNASAKEQLACSIFQPPGVPGAPYIDFPSVDDSEEIGAKGKFEPKGREVALYSLPYSPKLKSPRSFLLLSSMEASPPSLLPTLFSTSPSPIPLVIRNIYLKKLAQYGGQLPLRKTDVHDFPKLPYRLLNEERPRTYRAGCTFNLAELEYQKLDTLKSITLLHPLEAMPPLLLPWQSDYHAPLYSEITVPREFQVSSESL
jgi:hypothetical protein